MRILSVDPTDTFASIRDRLLQLGPDNTERVALVVPAEPVDRLSAVDLVLLRRVADRERIELGLVTGNRRVARQAREIGLPTFGSTVAAEYYRPGWWRGHRRRIKLGFVPGESPHKEALSAPIPLAAIGLLFLLVALIAAVIVALPRATVTLRPRSQVIQVITPLQADPNVTAVNDALGVVPAHPVNVTQDWVAEGPSTGDTEADGRRVRAQALQAVADAAPTWLAARLGPGELLVPGSVAVEVVDESLFADDGLVSVAMTVHASGLTSRREHLEAALVPALEAALPPGSVMLPDTVQVSLSPSSPGSADRFEATARAVGQAQIDAEALRSLLRWQHVSPVRRYLASLPLAEEAELSLMPAWWAKWFGRFPFFAERIAVEIVP